MNRAVVKSEEGKPIAVCWTGLAFGFSHPQRLLEYSAVISLQAAPQRSILSRSLAAVLLSVRPQISAPSASFRNSPPKIPLSSDFALVFFSFQATHLSCKSQLEPETLYQVSMAAVSLLLSSRSLLICNKAQGPAVTLIELWDHISPALEELDRLSMALCCASHTH